ncbi:MAG: hypothetical protein ACPGU7_07325 [Gammaproteobacteria bacterium]
MSDPVVWVIIVAFYAPLHYMLPALILFITGNEAPEVRKTMIRRAVIDATVSMVLAFALAIGLVLGEQFMGGMIVLFLSMLAPYVRIILNRRKMSAQPPTQDDA